MFGSAAVTVIGRVVVVVVSACLSLFVCVCVCLPDSVTVHTGRVFVSVCVSPRNCTQCVRVCLCVCLCS